MSQSSVQMSRTYRSQCLTLSYETINEVVFTLAHRIPDSTVYWYLDEQFIGTTHTFHELALKPKPGNYLLTAVDEEGNEIKQPISITFASL